MQCEKSLNRILVLSDYESGLGENGSMGLYLRDLPLHHSQEVVNEGDAFTDYKYYVRPSIDFISELLSKGDRIEVLTPAAFRDRIHEEHLKAAKRYAN